MQLQYIINRLRHCRRGRAVEIGAQGRDVAHHRRHARRGGRNDGGGGVRMQDIATDHHGRAARKTARNNVMRQHRRRIGQRDNLAMLAGQGHSTAISLIKPDKEYQKSDDISLCK